MNFTKKILSTIWDFTGRHAYLVTTITFIVVVGFLDPNSYYHRFLHKKEIQHLEDEIKNYEDIYTTDTKTLQELNANPKSIERIAREKYFMKRPNEDVYVFKN